MRKRGRVEVRLSVNAEMEVKLQLGVFMLLVQVSLAVWQHVTVMKGETLSLNCPITNPHKTHVDWKNPEGYIMFFNRNQALQDKRYSINKLSRSEFSISVSNVTFKDGGNYTCSHYGHRTTDKTVEVTVLGHPRMSVTRHEGKTVIKCTAEANHLAPQISWRFDDGSEFLVQAHVHREDKKYVSTAMLHVLPAKRVTVKCLVRHPALHTQHLMNFVNIGRGSKKSPHTTTVNSPTVQPLRPTGAPGTTTSWVTSGRTTVYSTTSLESSAVPSSDPRTVTAPTGFPLHPVTSPGSRLSTSDDSTTSVLPDSTSRSNDTTSNATTGWTTEDVTFDNSTERNRTGSFDSNMQQGTHGNSSVLVFLVTCLIFGLVVVVIFIGIKLRRAHLAWKRENEDSDQSEESSKSKSSQEEKNCQGQRRRGLFNTAFTQYVVEEPTVITSVPNTAAVTATGSVNKELNSGPQSLAPAKSNIKETSL